MTLAKLVTEVTWMGLKLGLDLDLKILMNKTITALKYSIREFLDQRVWVGN